VKVTFRENQKSKGVEVCTTEGRTYHWTNLGTNIRGVGPEHWGCEKVPPYGGGGESRTKVH